MASPMSTYSLISMDPHTRTRDDLPGGVRQDVTHPFRCLHRGGNSRMLVVIVITAYNEPWRDAGGGDIRSTSKGPVSVGAYLACSAILCCSTRHHGQPVYIAQPSHACGIARGDFWTSSHFCEPRWKREWCARRCAANAHPVVSGTRRSRAVCQSATGRCPHSCRARWPVENVRDALRQARVRLPADASGQGPHGGCPGSNACQARRPPRVQRGSRRAPL